MTLIIYSSFALSRRQVQIDAMGSKNQQTKLPPVTGGESVETIKPNDLEEPVNNEETFFNEENVDASDN